MEPAAATKKEKENIIISVMIYFKSGTPVSRKALEVSALMTGFWTCTWAKYTAIPPPGRGAAI